MQAKSSYSKRDSEHMLSYTVTAEIIDLANAGPAGLPAMQ